MSAVQNLKITCQMISWVTWYILDGLLTTLMYQVNVFSASYVPDFRYAFDKAAKGVGENNKIGDGIFKTSETGDNDLDYQLR